MNHQELGAARPSALFLRYVSLNVLSMLSLSVYILADTFFIANGVGNDGLTALNLVIPVYNFINGFGLMLGIGGATFYSFSLGAGDASRGKDIFTVTVLLAAGSSVLIGGLGLVFSLPLGELLGGRGQVLSYAVDYLRVIFGFAPAFLLNNVLVCFVRNDGEPRLAMTAMLVGSLFNIVLDYLLIFPLELKMMGAALATGVAPVLGLLISSLHFRKGKSRFRFSLRRGIREPIGRIFSLGLPSFINEMASAVVILAFNFVLLGLAGNLGVAAYGIIANLALIAVAVFTGVAQGIQPLVSFYHGAARKEGKRLLLWGCAAALLLGGVFCGGGSLFREGIISAFNAENDPILAQMAEECLLVYFTSFLPAGMTLVMISYFASVNRPLVSFFLSAARGVLFVLPLLFWLSSLFGLMGVWWSVPAAESLGLLAALLFFFFGRREKRLP